MTVQKAVGASPLRYVAAVGLVASILGRALAPALRGARQGLDRIIPYTDLAGSVASYLFAFAAIAMMVVQLSRTLQERRLGRAYRPMAMALGAAVLFLTAPALRHTLTERASIVTGASSGLLALVAVPQALRVGRTRALGVVLAAAGMAALLHLGGTTIAWYAGERAMYRLAVVARGLATADVAFDALGIATALAWLRTRDSKVNAWTTRLVLVVAFVVAWGAARGGSEGSPFWQLLAHRSIERLLVSPGPYVWLPLRYLLEAIAPLLGVVAVATRRQIAPVMGSLALVLLARPSTDVPLSALALALAALSAALTARDDRSMWAVVDGQLRPIG